jgi:uncharacterized protein
VKTYFLKLLPPRPTFAQDMTPAEAKLLQEHGEYWGALMKQGIAVVFGVVGDPVVPYGMGIVELPESADPHAIVADDPAIKADAGLRYEVYPMPRVVARRG